MNRRLTILLTTILTVCCSIMAASVKMSSSPARGKRAIEVGDPFYITIQVSDLDEQPSKPSSVPGAKLMYFERTGQSSSYSSVNGRVTQSYSYTYTMTLRALKEGKYQFGPISVGGVKSNTVSYNIVAAGAGHTPQASASATSPGNQNDQDDKPKYIGKGDGNLFLRANVTKTSVYEQEALVYTVKLYTTYDAIKFVGATAAPKFDGFVVEESKDISNSLTYETYNGKSYATAVIARYIIFPQITGQLKITGNTYTVSVDRREYYHDPFFGNMSYATPLQLNVTPNDLTINVKGLPTPKPADFSGGVGNFKISSALKSNTFKSNQASAIVYTVSGTGNLRYIQLPDLQTVYPPQLEVYTPTSKQDISVGSSNVSGQVAFDYSFMPLEEGTFNIPSVKLVYFNPSTGQYETSTARGYTITVGKGAANSTKGGRKQLKFDSELQKVDLSALAKTRSTFVYGFSYWLFYIIPVLLLLTAIILYRRYVGQRADMATFRSNRADKMARRRLRKARVAMTRGAREEFHTEMLKALWGYLGDKLKMPTSELMRDNIRQMLDSKSIPVETTDALIALIDDIEFAKYSSANVEGEMNDTYEKGVRIINRLEDDFKKTTQQREK